MRIDHHFKDYTLLDMADGEKLEKWGEYVLIRPDPQIVWTEKKHPELWKKADARYVRSSTGGGHWETYKPIKESWKITFENLQFHVKPMGFKHTGLFPEQAVNWEYAREHIQEKVKEGKTVRVLNLFAYTGGATIACAAAGATVCHVDSSQGMTNWAKENLILSGLKDKPVRFLVDDVLKFVSREIRRGNQYDVIIMDPPSYGRGKNGEVWNIEKDLYPLLQECSQLLSDTPLFLMVNTYTGGLSGTIIANVCKLAFETRKPQIHVDEIGIEMSDQTLVLPCGITTICEF